MNNVLWGDTRCISNSGGGTGQQNIWAYNNSWKCTREYLALEDVVRGGDSFDYNNYDSTGAVRWRYGATDTTSFTTFKANSGHDSNGMNVDSDFDANFKPNATSYRCSASNRSVYQRLQW